MSKLGLRDKGGNLIEKMLRFDANWTTTDAAVMHFVLEEEGHALRFFMLQSDADAYVNDLNQRRAGNPVAAHPGTGSLCEKDGTPLEMTMTYEFAAVQGVPGLLRLTTTVGVGEIDVFMTVNQADRYINTLDQDLGLPKN